MTAVQPVAIVEPKTRRRHGQLHHRLRGLLVIAAAMLAASTVNGLPLAILVLVAALAAVLIAARPDAAALVAVGLLYSNAVVVLVRHHGAPSATAAIVPLLFLITIGYRALARREPFLLPRAGLWVVAYLVVQMIGSATSRDPVTSMATLQTFLSEGLLLFLLVTNGIRGYEMIRLAAIVLLVSAAVLGTASAVQDAVGGDLGGFATISKAVVAKDSAGGGAKRHAGPIGEQNRWAQSLAVLVPIALALGLDDRSRGVRWLARFCLIGIAIGLILTYSRGAVVGLIITGVIAVAARWVRVKVAVTVALIAIVVVGAFAPIYASRTTTVLSAGSSVNKNSDPNAQVDGSFANRANEASAALSVFSHHPVVGVGVGLFPTYYQDQARQLGADRIVGVDREAHDLYLGIVAETGLLGLITVIGLMGALIVPLVAIRRRYRERRPDVAGLATGFCLGLVTYLATGIFLHFAYIRYFWLLAGLAAAMGMIGEPNDPISPTNRGRRAHRTVRSLHRASTTPGVEPISR